MVVPARAELVVFDGIECLDVGATGSDADRAQAQGAKSDLAHLAAKYRWLDGMSAKLSRRFVRGEPDQGNGRNSTQLAPELTRIAGPLPWRLGQSAAQQIT